MKSPIHNKIFKNIMLEQHSERIGKVYNGGILKPVIDLYTEGEDCCLVVFNCLRVL